MAKSSDHNDDLIKNGKDKFKQKFDSKDDSNIIDFIAALEDRDQETSILKELNSKHIFINSIGGSPRITSKVYNEVTNREELEYISVDSFQKVYSNRFIPGYKIPVCYGQWWLSSGGRNTVESVMFDPRLAVGAIEINNKRYLNLWEGFGVVPKKGKWYYTKRHIYKILCNSDKEKFKYVMRWLAYAVQNPDKQAESCLVFKGKMGAGKSFLFEQFKTIFANHGMVISDRNRLTGRFTGHFRSLCFLFCDEVYYPGDKEIQGRMNALITSKFLDTEQKNLDAVTIANRLHIVMCTNNEWVIPASAGERRYFIDEVSDVYAKNVCSEPKRKVYFTRLHSEMDNGGREAMLFDLLKCSIQTWHPRDNIPQTSELQKQKELSLNYIQQAMKQMLEDGVFPGQYVRLTYGTSSEVFCSHLDKIDNLCAKFSSIKKTKLIKELGCVKGRIAGIGRSKWEFPELPEMRANWDKIYGKNKWDNETKWAVLKTEF